MGRIVPVLCMISFFPVGVGPVHADVNEELQGIKKEISEKKLLLKKTRKVETRVSGELENIGKDLQEKRPA